MANSSGKLRLWKVLKLQLRAVPIFCVLWSKYLLNYASETMQDYLRWSIEQLQSFYLDIFHYTRPTSPTSIRLIKIAPGILAAPISCSLENVCLEDKPQFVAISYSWVMDRSIKSVAYYFFKGVFKDDPSAVLTKILEFTDPKDLDYWITCNGKRLRVTQNLYNCMLQLRQSHPEKSFWIDAICINQEDVAERNEQVLLMNRIYSSAEMVISWLGTNPSSFEITNSTAMFIYTAEIILSGQLGDLALHFPDSKAALLDTTLIAYAILSFYILSRRYFRRAWIVQEVILGKKLVIMLGRHEITPEALMAMLEFVSDPVRRNGLTDMILGMFLEFYGSSVSHLQALFAARNGFDLDQAWNLEEYLLAIAGRSSNDPRDMIFAGFGLVDPGSTSIHGTRFISENLEKDWNLWTSLHADYSASLKDVYVNCAAALFSGRAGLDALAFASGYQTQPGLPSWVPKLQTKSAFLKQHVGDIFKAGGESDAPNISITENGMVLSLDDGADHLDKVAWRVNLVDLFSSNIHGILEIFLKLPAIYEPTGEKMLTAIARTLIADHLSHQQPAPETVEQDLQRWLEQQVNQEKAMINKRISEAKAEGKCTDKHEKDAEKLQTLIQSFGEFLTRNDFRSEDKTSKSIESQTLSATESDIMAMPSPTDVSSETTPLINKSVETLQIDCSQPAPAPAPSSVASFFKPSSQFLTALAKLQAGNCFFVTTRNYIGIGIDQANIKPIHRTDTEKQRARDIAKEQGNDFGAGDSTRPGLATSILIVSGAGTPFAMNPVCDFKERVPFSTLSTIEEMESMEQQSREQESIMYEMIGEVYVHGFMKGERLRSKEWNLKKVHLL